MYQAKLKNELTPSRKKTEFLAITLCYFYVISFFQGFGLASLITK